MVTTAQNIKQKPGYKQTEIGVIPENWEVHTLGDEVDQLEAGVSVNSVDEEFHIYAHEQAILKTSSVSNGCFLPHENKKIAPQDIKRAKLSPRVDSIIISRMNTPDLVGECGYVEKNYPNLFLPDQGVSLLNENASRFRSSEMVQFGPEICGNYPKWRDEEDERSS